MLIFNSYIYNRIRILFKLDYFGVGANNASPRDAHLRIFYCK